MAKSGAGGTGMTSGEKLLGGVVLAVYVFVLPLTAEWLFNGAERLFGVSLDRGLRDAAYYAVLFGLVLIAFWGFFGRNTPGRNGLSGPVPSESLEGESTWMEKIGRAHV